MNSKNYRGKWKQYSWPDNGTQQENEIEMQKDEVELLLEKGFFNVDPEIAYSKIIPGKIKRIRNSLTNDDCLSIILVS